MSDATKPVAPTKGAAARAEKNGKGTEKQITWLKRKFKMPAEDCLGVLLMDLPDLNRQGELISNLAIIREALGDEQYEEARKRLAAERLPMKKAEKLIGDLADKILAAYGMTEGESEASPGS